jgi:NAD(P)-dependent dehydrogenase (short-subunit alcohol dehydrogenase family)/acyl carrier protein
VVSAGVEDQIAVRDGLAHVARLLESTTAGNQSLPIRLHADATYLITGGLGRLGSKVARWMVARGARHLVLTGRHTRNEDLVRALESAGASVTVAHGDVSDAAWVSSLLAQLATADAPLRGIVHAAGVSTRRALLDLDRQAFESDFAPKVRGSWLLHQGTEGIPLDFFVMFSTAAAIWGARDMASYAAANHFLDALAQYRRQAGLAALSVNWGPWDEVGVMSDDVQRVWDRIGLPAMPEAAALEALERLMVSGAATKTVACVDWDRFKAIHETRTLQPFLEHVGHRENAGAETAPEKPSALLASLAGASPQARQASLMTHVQREVCDILGLDLNASLDPARGFAQMGLDSLMAIDLRNRLQKVLGRSLPSPVVFNYPNVRALATYLAGDSASPAASAPAVAPSSVPASARPLAADEITDLSDEEAEALLATRIAALGRGGA